MPGSAPVEVILAAFNDEQGAEAALEELKKAQKEHLIDIDNTAILRRDKEGKLHIKEAKDMGGGRGAVVGGVAGAVAGLVFGPLVLAAAGGAALGGLVAKLHDSGFDDKRLKQLGENLQPGTSAIVAVIEHIWVTQLEEELRKAGADVATEALGADIAEQLKAGKDVAYVGLVTDDSVMTARATADRAPAPTLPASPPASEPSSSSAPPPSSPPESPPEPPKNP